MSVFEWAVRAFGALAFVAGIAGVVVSGPLGDDVSPDKLWGMEPLAYVGLLTSLAGLGLVSLSYVVPHALVRTRFGRASNTDISRQWSTTTQQYFDLFNHDLGRPLRRILGKEREIRAVLGSQDLKADPRVLELLDEIEQQAPNFRLMMANIGALVQLEAPHVDSSPQPVEPSEIVRRIVDRYTPIASESKKEITWWSDPGEYGIVYSYSPAIEHIVTNLVDNGVRFARSHVEVKLTKNPTHFFIRVWDDGPGMPHQYIQHVFDRGWTPEVSRREEKSSSGLGLFIARTMARRHGGELTVDSTTGSGSDHQTAFLLSLPLLDPPRRGARESMPF